MITRRVNVYMLVVHGLRYRDRWLASWQEVGQVTEGPRGFDLGPWKREDPERRFETGLAYPVMPYGYILPPIKRGARASYGTNDA